MRIWFLLGTRCTHSLQLCGRALAQWSGLQLRMTIQAYIRESDGIVDFDFELYFVLFHVLVFVTNMGWQESFWRESCATVCNCSTLRKTYKGFQLMQLSPSQSGIDSPVNHNPLSSLLFATIHI